MKRELVDLDVIDTKLTSEELAFNNFYYTNMYRLGLFYGFDDNNKRFNFYPFKSEKEYTDAKYKATSLLYKGKSVPKDLEEKLLIVKQNREKQSI